MLTVCAGPEAAEQQGHAAWRGARLVSGLEEQSLGDSLAQRLRQQGAWSGLRREVRLFRKT